MKFEQVLHRYVVLDIETTGFSRESDSVIEIAAATYDNGERTGVFQSFVCPNSPIPLKITELTSICQDDVANAPPICELLVPFFDFIGDRPIVGHNITAFDIPFLSCKFERRIFNDLYDTLPLSRNSFPGLPSYTLTYLNSVLHLSDGPAHRAITDIDTTNALLYACMAPEEYTINLSDLPAAPVRKRSKKSKFSPSCDHRTITLTPGLSTCSGCFSGKIVVFTGTLSMPRAEAMQKAVDAGAILRNSISSKTAYLVVGSQDKSIVGEDGMSSKEELAYALNQSGKANIQIICEAQFLALLQEQKEGAVL